MTLSSATIDGSSLLPANSAPRARNDRLAGSAGRVGTGAGFTQDDGVCPELASAFLHAGFANVDGPWRAGTREARHFFVRSSHGRAWRKDGDLAVARRLFPMDLRVEITRRVGVFKARRQ